MRNHFLFLLLFAGLLTFTSCDDDDDTQPMGTDPDTAEEQSVDRFSADAGMLFVRDQNNDLPEANEPIDFDQHPFITKGFGPDGSMVEYYNFDAQSTNPAPIYVPMHDGSTIEDQLNIIDVIPGDANYNDFWQVMIVEVPEDYVANTLTSRADIVDEGYTITPTNNIVNCPVVPDGSTASKRVGGGDTGLVRGWYKGKVVYYFNFSEKDLSGTTVPLSPIYVAFNINPGEPGGGASSGHMAEANGQTHNVVATLPSDPGYSPLWSVNVYDNADFNMVDDLASAQAANILATGVATVNCPIVSQ